MATVSQIVIEMAANVARLRQDMDAAKGVVGDAMSSIKGYADIASRALIGVGVGLSVIGAGKFLASLVMDVAEAQAGLLKMSQVTGATVEGLSAIRGMAKLTGTDMESVGTAMVKLAKNVETGSAATEKGLNAIGMSTKDLQGLKSDEMYKKIADTLNQYEEGAKKTAVATELMGKAGAQQLPLMKALAENGDLVAKTTTEQAEQAEHLERNITRLSMAQQAWKKIVGAELVPVLDSVVSVLIKMQTESNGTLDAAKKYSADGSIKSWAQSAAIAVAYVIDFLLGLKAVFVVVGSALAAFAASSVQALGGIADLLIAVVKGQYSSIPGIVKSTLAAVSTIVQAAGEDISDAWSKTRVVDKLRDQFQDDAQDAGEALDKVKKKIGALGETAGASVEKINALGKALNELLNKLNNPDIDAALVKEQELLTKAFQVGALGLNSYVRAMSLAILESKTFKDANEAIAKSLSENEAIIQTNRQAIEDAAKSVADGNLQLTNEIATLGMTTLTGASPCSNKRMQ